MGVIEPQPGPQTAFLSSPADIAIYGGAAGGGKSWALLAEPLRHIHKPGFGAVIFRRNLVQVINQGGLWDEAARLYPLLKGTSTQRPLAWTFPAKTRVTFAHLEDDRTVEHYQGAQIPLIGFDELTHFTRHQFFYMLSRNRSLCGVKPYVRATCNPDSESWVARFIDWWVDPDSGLPIPERSGVIRWMVHIDDRVVWADSRAALVEDFGPEAQPKSVTFIAASLFDNRILMAADPGYLANLTALPRVERERLLRGNWKIRPTSGLYFKREWCPVVEAAPADLRLVRYWDLAATEKTARNDPDYTVSVKMGRAEDGRIYVLHGLSLRQSPLAVQRAVLNVAEQDGAQVQVGLPQDPGQAGKAQVRAFAALLANYRVTIRRESGDKVTRFGPFSAQCEAGNVSFVRGDWTDAFFDHLEAFPDARHDDHADACSGAYALLTEARTPLRINPRALNGVPHVRPTG